MKVTSVQLAQCAFMGTFFSPTGIHLVEAVKALQEKYLFIKVPQSISELDPAAGIEFSHGKFNDSIIQKFTVYQNGMLVQSANTVEHAEDFLDDILAWARENYGMGTIESLPIYRSYDSQIVFQSDIDFADKFLTLNPVLSALHKIMLEAGMEVPKYSLSGLNFYSDLHEFTGLRPGHFTIERRVQTPYGSNLFFSVAPIKTKAHIELLKSAENLLR